MQVRLEKVQLIWDKFYTIQQQIEYAGCEGEEEGEEEDQERADFEERYCDLESKARALIERIAREQNPVLPHRRMNDPLLHQNRDENRSNPVINVRLPTLQLPAFHGQYDKWLEFKDAFLSMIHNNDALLPQQKMQ